MRVIMKTIFFVTFFLNIQLFGVVEISIPKGKIYFSKDILLSGLKVAKTQLFLSYSYFFKEISSDFDKDWFEDLPQQERIKIQTFFHGMKNRYKNMLQDLDSLQNDIGKNPEEINVGHLESLIHNLALLHDFFNYSGSLKMNFENYKRLNYDVLNKVKNNKEKVEVTFDVCCNLIEELFRFNDFLITKNVPLFPIDLFPDTEKPFSSGFFEYSVQEKLFVPHGYLLVNFQKPTL